MLTDTKPARIQRKRVKGWKKPEGAVIVTRPSRFGNPFTVADAIEWAGSESESDARRHVTSLYRQWLDGELSGGPGPKGTSWSAERRDWIRDHVGDLRGKDLACYCPLPAEGEPDHCHASVLITLAAGAAL